MYTKIVVILILVQFVISKSDTLTKLENGGKKVDDQQKKVKPSYSGFASNADPSIKAGADEMADDAKAITVAYDDISSKAFHFYDFLYNLVHNKSGDFDITYGLKAGIFIPI